MKLTTRRGEVELPTYLPVLTGQPAHRVEQLARPYLPRLARAVMVSAPWLADVGECELPVVADSGGFAALRAGGGVEEEAGLGVVVTPQGGRLHPREVLELQERHAEVALSLDLAIPPDTPVEEARRRQALSLANARWARDNRRRRDLPLWAVLPVWELDELEAALEEVEGFEGIALGGLVPRRAMAVEAVRRVRRRWEGPLHVLGLGEPGLVGELYEAGATSVDSSSWARLAASGRSFAVAGLSIEDPSPDERLRLALVNLAVATRVGLPLGVREVLLESWR